jgi:hypothetical protein
MNHVPEEPFKPFGPVGPETRLRYKPFLTEKRNLPGEISKKSRAKNREKNFSKKTSRKLIEKDSE